MTRHAATLAGFGAIMLWSLLALFTALSGEIPPFQLAAMSFAVGGVLGLVTGRRTPEGFTAFRQPAAVWVVGVGGLFGYHFLYFSALRAAPAVEASLIAYLWPLLIVLFSALLPGERLRWFHVAGALIGFAGAALIVTGGTRVSLNPDHVDGYIFALAAAFVWATYSVMSRRFSGVSTHAVTGFCLGAAVLSLGCHLGLEQTVVPGGPLEWLAVLGLGLGPLGLAFFLWDRGMKHGDIRILGAAGYVAPLLSTVILVAAGVSQPSWIIALACLLITAGAVLAAAEMLASIFRRSARE